MQVEALKAFVIEKLEEIKGRDITTLDIAKKSGFADYMVVCSGNSNRHVKSIAQSIAIECRAQGIEPLGIEGNDVGEWAVGAMILSIVPLVIFISIGFHGARRVPR